MQHKKIEGMRFLQTLRGAVYEGRKIGCREFRQLARCVRSWRDTDDMAEYMIGLRGRLYLKNGKIGVVDVFFSYQGGEASYYRLDNARIMTRDWKYVIFPRALTLSEMKKLIQTKRRQGRPLMLTVSEKELFVPKIKGSEILLEDMFKEITSLLREDKRVA